MYPHNIADNIFAGIVALAFPVGVILYWISIW